MSQFSSASSGLQQCQSSADHPTTTLLRVLSKSGQVLITLTGSPVLVTTPVVLILPPPNYMQGPIVMTTIRTPSMMSASPTSLLRTAAPLVVSLHAYAPPSSCLDSSPVVFSHSLIDGSHLARSSRPLSLTLPLAVLCQGHCPLYTQTQQGSQTGRW
jgi:hypothetical protein